MLRHFIHINLFMISVLILASCSYENIQSVTTLKEVAAEVMEEETLEDYDTFKLAIVSILSIRETHKIYNKFEHYLESELGKPVEIIQKQTYSEVKEMFENGEIDAGIVCSFLAVTGEEAGILRIISMPIINSEPTFTSYIITQKDSEIEKFEDLQGRSFAFSDPLSYSGYFVTKYDLSKQNYDIDNFFSKTYFTYSHDNTILAVANGLVEGGATHSSVYHHLQENNNPLIDNIKIIHEGANVGNSPLVVHPLIEESLEKKLIEIVETMHLNEKGKKALKNLNIDSFVQPKKRLYEPIIQMLNELGEQK